MTVSSRRRRSVPWIYRYSRRIITAIAGAGLLLTAYLTVMKLTGSSVICPTDGCDRVLNSPYAVLFGVPLSAIGFLAYGAVLGLALSPNWVSPERKTLRSQVEDWSGLLLLALGTGMAVFSSFLIYLLLIEIRAFCPYCWGSALFSFSLFLLAALGRPWEDLGRPVFVALVVALVAFTSALGLHARISGTSSGPVAAADGTPPAVTTESGPAEIALAEHLAKIGAKEYGAFWCPHCYDQKQLFGKAAAAKVPYIECDPNGKNARPDLCRSAGIEGFPSWDIGGKRLSGVQPLEKLANLSGYRGPRDFRHTSPLAR